MDSNTGMIGVDSCHEYPMKWHQNPPWAVKRCHKSICMDGEGGSMTFPYKWESRGPQQGSWDTFISVAVQDRWNYGHSIFDRCFTRAGHLAWPCHRYIMFPCQRIPTEEYATQTQGNQEESKLWGDYICARLHKVNVSAELPNLILALRLL